MLKTAVSSEKHREGGGRGFGGWCRASFFFSLLTLPPPPSHPVLGSEHGQEEVAVANHSLSFRRCATGSYGMSLILRLSDFWNRI